MWRDKEVKNLILTAEFEKAESYVNDKLSSEIVQENIRRLYFLFVCARFKDDKEAIENYYRQFQAIYKKGQLHKDEYWHRMESIYLLFSHELERANKSIDWLKENISEKHHSNEHYFSYASTLLYQMIYYYEKKEFVQAIQLYNRIPVEILVEMNRHLPFLYMYIHMVIMCAYMELNQWHTAKELLHVLKTYQPPPDKYIKAHVVIYVGDHLFECLFDKQHFSLEHCQDMMKQCLPMSKMALRFVLRFVEKVLEVLPLDEIKQLYKEWARHEHLLQ